ncbi:Maf family protein [Catenovulum sediminis]|uniref:dTTP/UTP pyrophosphatase n=1 Tax=Catenovulum sediminis TaxID=1740262 RepID=A0ABV1RD61_9ALTE
MTLKIYLASRSPRRHSLLKQLNVDFTQVDGEIDESVHSGENAQAYVARLALEKAKKGWSNSDRDRPVLGADTIVVVDGNILGKPVDFSDSRRMLKSMSNRSHQVMTAVAIYSSEQLLQTIVLSDVEFCELDDKQIETYWQTGEPQDKAGSYAIQGIGGQFVKKINGSYSAIVGLPLYETNQLLDKVYS